MNSRMSIATPITEVDDEIARYFKRKTLSSAHLGPWFEHLWALTSTRVLGGKCVRPKLFLAAHDAFSDADEPRNADVITVAVAMELLHYSFLLHDDVIDGDTMRRGKNNLIGMLAEMKADAAGTPQRRLHWAQSCAILMGNLLLSDVHQMFAALNIPNTFRTRMLELLDHTITESVAGEQLDVGLSDGVVAAELSTILTMCGYKTATYTFEFPLRAAATMAGADPQVDPILSQAGHLLGVAFQLQDDLLSVFGDAKEHGKDSFSDLREGKETAIIAYARMTSHWLSIEPVFGKADLTDPEGTLARDHLIRSGAKGFVEGLIEEQIRALHELLAEHQEILPKPLITLLLDLATELEGRTS